MSTQSEIAFAKWLEKNDPYLFAVAAKVAEKKKGSGLGFLNLNWAAIGKAAMTTVKEIAPAVVQLQTQKRALDINLKRAEQGKPPVDFQDYTPAIKIDANITPQAEAAINRSAETVINTASAKVQNALPYLIAGGAVLLFLLKRR